MNAGIFLLLAIGGMAGIYGVFCTGSAEERSTWLQTAGWLILSALGTSLWLMISGALDTE